MTKAADLSGNHVLHVVRVRTSAETVIEDVLTRVTQEPSTTCLRFANVSPSDSLERAAFTHNNEFAVDSSTEVTVMP